MSVVDPYLTVTEIYKVSRFLFFYEGQIDAAQSVIYLDIVLNHVNKRPLIHIRFLIFYMPVILLRPLINQY